MSKPDENLSPDKKGESKKKKLSATNDIELIEFNIKIPTVYYDFFSAVIKLLEWDYEHVVDFFEESLMKSLMSQMRCDRSLVLPDSFLEKFDRIYESFMGNRRGEKSNGN